MERMDKATFIGKRDEVMGIVLEQRRELAAVEEQLAIVSPDITWSTLSYLDAIEVQRDDVLVYQLRERKGKLVVQINAGEGILHDLNQVISSFVEQEDKDMLWKTIPTILTLAGVGLLAIVNVIVFLNRIGQ